MKTLPPSYRNIQAFFLSVLTLIVFCSQMAVGQQTGQLYGIITDNSTGEALIGVNVVINGTTLGSSTDLDGKFNIRKVPGGTYDIRVSAVGYTAKVIRGIRIVPDQQLTLNVTLTVEISSVQEVVVEAEMIKSSESAILSERKKAAAISDGISAEQIKRTPDATSGDALRRVTGLSVVDNKFVYIRGITDRYNETTLDGASITSTEAGKKSFSFDMVPANLLENISVVKSATPDLPSDFSGGLVQLNTLDFPTSRVVKLNVGGSYNNITTTKDFLTSQGGSRDWLGFDDGTRAFPNDQSDLLSIAQAASNTWAPRSRTALYNGSISLAIGDRIDFDKDNPSNNQIGFIGALSYRNSFQRNQKLINDVALGRTNTGTKDNYSILWGAIANLSYKFAGLHKVSFKNNFNQSADDNISRYRSEDLGTSLENMYTIVNWTQRSTYTGQLTGEHSFPAIAGLSLQWKGAVSSSRREDPDRKEITFSRDLYDTTQSFAAAINQRSWAHLNERSYTFHTDFTLPLSAIRIKAGSLVESRTTNYGIRYFSVTPDYLSRGSVADSLTRLALDVIYSPQNYGKGKFLFGESSKSTDSYDGDQKLYAAYVMLDIPFDLLEQKFRFAGGARLENSEHKVSVPRTIAPSGPVTSTQLKNVDLLPSFNFTYIMNSMTNIRLAYSQSVNRPEFRELASTGFYDFIKYELVGGNPNLQRSFIHNYDIRVEVFPEIGELLAVSYFRKSISDAIEEQLVQTATRTRTWFNSSSASNSGWEFEVRKSLSFIGGYFNNVTFSGNYTRIESSVEIIETQGNSQNTYTVRSTRPLQGQSPYMMNFSILFTEPTLGTSLNILYNKFGRKLDAVGFLASDIYEEPRDLVDLAITQPLVGGLEAKFTIKNLNAKERILTRDSQLYDRTSTGRTYSLQLTLGL